MLILTFEVTKSMFFAKILIRGGTRRRTRPLLYLYNITHHTIELALIPYGIRIYSLVFLISPVYITMNCCFRNLIFLTSFVRCIRNCLLLSTEYCCQKFFFERQRTRSLYFVKNFVFLSTKIALPFKRLNSSQQQSKMRQFREV